MTLPTPDEIEAALLEMVARGEVEMGIDSEGEFRFWLARDRPDEGEEA